jgi:hypothetical protein
MEYGRRSECSCSIGVCPCAGVRARMEVGGVGTVPEGGERMFVGVIVAVDIGESTIT